MKILFLCNDLPYFIAHRSSILKTLLACGYHVSVCAGGDSAKASELPIGVNFYKSNIDRNGFNLISDLRYVYYLFNIIRIVKPNIVHSITIKPNIYGAFATAILGIFGMRSPRLIMTFPGLGKLFEAKSNVILQSLQMCIKTCLKWTAKRIDHRATFENYSDRNFMVANRVFDPEFTFVTYGAGIDTSVFFPSRISRSGPIVFLFASRLISSKGVGIFIDAARNRKKNGSKARFLVAGPMDKSNPDCFDLGTLEKAIAENVIDYKGNITVDAMPDLLRSVDVMCLPTQLAEGFPRSLIEAASCGNAMIASRIASVAQIIIETETGFMIDPFECTELAQHMEKMEANPNMTRAMGKKAAEFVRRMPADEQQVNEVFLSLYR